MWLLTACSSSTESTPFFTSNPTILVDSSSREMSSLFLSSSRDTASIPAMMTCFTKHCTRVKTSLYVIMDGAQGLSDFRLWSRATGAPQYVQVATAGGLHSLNCPFQSPTPAPINGLGNFGQIWSRCRQPTTQIARRKMHARRRDCKHSSFLTIPLFVWEWE